jgi:hypothetical protein
MRLQPGQRALFVFSHQARIACDIGSKDRDQTAGRAAVVLSGTRQRGHRPVFDAGYRRDKPIAACGDGLDTACVRSPFVKHAAQRRDLDGQIGILDDRPSPDGGHDLLFRDQITRPLDK